MCQVLRKCLNKQLCVFALLCTSSVISLGHEYDGHNKELRAVLFGEKTLSAKGEDNFRLLCEAAYLALDFTNFQNGRDYLDDLRNNGVKGLPSDIKEIEFGGNSRHQMYTHMGWDVGYRGCDDKANWAVRKQILVNTVKKIGGFKKEEAIKIDAFAALVYEIHILGDYIGDSDATRLTRVPLSSGAIPGYRGQEVSPDSDGPFNNPTLVTYMLYHIQRLFREQTSSENYERTINMLRVREKFLLYHEENKLGEKVPYEKLQALALDIKRNLQYQLPPLLSREQFIQSAFFQ